jgi:AraC-like DNA-binding protein
MFSEEKRGNSDRTSILGSNFVRASIFTELARSDRPGAGKCHRTAKAVAWLRSNYEKPLRIEHLATIAGMSRSTLHHHFRALTAMSPLQFQKQLRLHAARQRMLTGELDAASAAFEVGYESPSQFNREYRRFFGQPPIRDIKALRDGKVFGAVCRCDDNCCARRVPREGGQRLQRAAAASLSPRARNPERSPTHFP